MQGHAYKLLVAEREVYKHNLCQYNQELREEHNLENKNQKQCSTQIFTLLHVLRLK